MPMYDYLCPHCGSAFEELRPMAERDTAECPNCGRTADKQVSSFFTGGGSGAAASQGSRGGSCDVGGFGGG